MKFIFIIIIFIIYISNLCSQVNLDSGLVAYYPFNGNTNDESGNGNNGNIFGATLSADRFGNDSSAYHFDGDDYIKAMADGLPTGERTTSLWLNADSLSSQPVLLGYGGNGPPGTSWWMNINHGGTPAYFLGIHYTPSNYLTYNYTSEPIGEWINFVTTTDSSGSRIYINGSEMASNNLFINNTFVIGKDLAIGVNVSGDGIAPYTGANVGYFVGDLDEIRIYNRKLTPEEIDSLYNEGTTSIELASTSFPSKIELSQNYPNPFNPSTKIKYNIPEKSFVLLRVYDILGNKVETLVYEEQSIGNYEVVFDAIALTSGIYFYKL